MYVLAPVWGSALWKAVLVQVAALLDELCYAYQTCVPSLQHTSPLPGDAVGNTAGYHIQRIHPFTTGRRVLRLVTGGEARRCEVPRTCD